MATSRRKQKAAKSEPVAEPKHIQSTHDAANDAACKINVAITLLWDIHDPERTEKADDDGGFTLTTAIDLLAGIRDELRASVEAEVEAAEARRAAVKA